MASGCISAQRYTFSAAFRTNGTHFGVPKASGCGFLHDGRHSRLVFGGTVRILVSPTKQPASQTAGQPISQPASQSSRCMSPPMYPTNSSAIRRRTRPTCCPGRRRINSTALRTLLACVCFPLPRNMTSPRFWVTSYHRSTIRNNGRIYYERSPFSRFALPMPTFDELPMTGNEITSDAMEGTINCWIGVAGLEIN